jgi:prophage lambdaSa04, tail tape measure protein, family|nr:MAG TPA: minor tail protein [Caudoviricetes sp.]
MAGNIKGIKIEIDGDTQPLQKALKNVNKAANDASQELKQIDKALKFDTGNVTLLTQKQEVLQKQVATTKEKLETLRQAQSQVEQQFKNGDIGADQYRAFQREVEVTQNVLKGYEGKLASVNQALSGNGQATENNISKLNNLQNEQSQLASEMEKVTSSFKLQESALGSNASEAERNALAQKKIGAQSDIVNKQISNLERQLELTKKEFGENSTQANKMESELNQAKTALNHLNNEMNQTKSSADNAQDGMTAMSNTIRAEALQRTSEKLAELSQKILEVGASSIEAAAQIQASNAQFTTVFGDMEAQARESLNAIGQEMDIVPERLQGSFTQMASFAKTSGLDTAQALDLTSRATRAAADGAAFYDKSIESVSESLQSFLKGNFANDAALGISATETTRNAAANKLYGKSFKDLSEAQKQLTLLQMVEDGNKLSGALGQAQREADGLENVMGNLKQSGTNALAVIGQPILEMLIPVFQALGKIVNQVATWFSNLSAPIKQAIIVFVGLLAVVGALLPIFLAVQVAAVAMETTVLGLIGSFIPIIGTVLGVVAVITLLIIGLKELWENNETFKNFVINTWESIKSAISSAIHSILEIVQTIWNALLALWKNNQDTIYNIASTVWNAISTTVLTVVQAISTVVQDVWGILTNWWKTNQEDILKTASYVWNIMSYLITLAITGIDKVIQDVFGGMIAWWESNHTWIMEIVNTVWGAIQTAISTAIQNVSDFIISVFGGITEWIDENQALIESTFKIVWETISTIIGTTINIITTVIQVAMEYLVPYFEAMWTNMQTSVSLVWEVLKTVVQTAISVIQGIITAIMQVINGDWSGAWETIKNTMSVVWEAIKSIVSTVISSISSIISTAWQGISTTIGNIMNGISSTVSSVWNGIKNSIGSAINGAKDLVSTAINTIKGLFNFSISWPHIPLPHFSVSGSANPLDWLSQGVPSISIEWYAKGGIMTKPTIFGMNGNNLMVGGEAGNEAVLPLNDKTLGAIGRGIAQTMGGTSPTINITITGNTIREEADISRIADEVAQRIADELQRKTQLRGGVAW